MAAGATYEPIATQTLTSAYYQIDFTSIPSTYTDLFIVWNLICSTTSNGYPMMWFNGSTTTVYSGTFLNGNGTAASSNRTSASTSGFLQYNSAYTTQPGTSPVAIKININDYANTTTNKTFLSTVATGQSGVGAMTASVGLWRSTAAINRIRFLTDNALDMAIGTSVTLYGIKAA